MRICTRHAEATYLCVCGDTFLVHATCILRKFCLCDMSHESDSRRYSYFVGSSFNEQKISTKTVRAFSTQIYAFQHFFKRIMVFKFIVDHVLYLIPVAGFKKTRIII